MSTLSNEDIERHFGQLAELEKEFDQVDIEILRETTLKQRHLYTKRNAVTSEIKGFWPQVLDEASSSLGFDEHITPEDSAVLEHLTEINVVRPNVEDGDPRDFDIVFKFDDNDYMPAQTVTKSFTYQPSMKVNSTGLISTPTPIIWKDGKDLTGGINKAAIEAFEERKAKTDSKKGKGSAKLGQKEGKLLELLTENSSFFAWFSYSGVHFDLGETERDDNDSDKMDDDEDDKPVDYVEAFHYGDELAIQIAEDLYPSAVKYFTASLEESESDDEISLSGSDEDDDEPQQHSHSHGGRSCGSKHKHSHSHGETAGEPAKKKPRK
ncbi:hypothetical protein FN846DRAFT_367046 [Sphaerosporella brunnea]|uniref:Nucleosome assembly protein n=1 Tax=Sphaerosporella brunnea TaxID=1250544 RepID=A0A5J5EJ15_9PEZI|nr:hypothetical protein FN846DRAFT_367046 [Sphaerosporella brunnea]